MATIKRKAVSDSKVFYRTIFIDIERCSQYIISEGGKLQIVFIVPSCFDFLHENIKSIHLMVLYIKTFSTAQTRGCNSF